MLQFENVSTFYGKIQALHNVNVEIRQGEIVTLIGANGAGKSHAADDALRFAAGAQRQHQATWVRTIGQNSSQNMRKSIAWSPEGRRVFARHDRGRKPRHGRLLHRQGRLSGTDGQGSRTVSTPERTLRPARRHHVRRRTANARHRPCADEQPKLLLLDEPWLGLAPIIIQQIFDIIESCARTV